MIISINGPAGSGKSTLAKRLAEKLGWPRYYMGGLRRQKAKERGLTLAEYNKLGEEDPATDREVDEYQAELGKTRDNFVIEGRTSWLFIPHSLKIYLDVDEKEGARRIYSDLQRNPERNEDNKMATVEDVLASMRERYKSDVKRYQKYYRVNAYDSRYYDYVLDSTGLSSEQVFDRVHGFVLGRLKNQRGIG